MQINIIYVPVRMDFTLDTNHRMLGPGVYGLTDGNVQFLCNDLSISLDDAHTLAAHKMGVSVNG